MHPVDRVRIRIVDAVGSGVITIIIAAIVSSFIDSRVFSGNVFSSAGYLVLLSLAALPLILTLVGLAVAVYRARPFGFFGFLFELGGVNTLFNNPEGAAFVVIVFGAILVVLGAFIWSWTPVLEALLHSRKRRAPPRGGFR